MRTAIITDADCDIDEAFANRRNIFFVKHKVHFGDKVFRLNVNISRDEFIDLIKKSGEYPTTSIPSIKDVENLFSYLRRRGFKRFVVVSLSKPLSNMIDVYKQVFERNKWLASSILVDAKSTTFAQGMLALLLSALPLDEMSKEEIILKANYIRENLLPFGVVSDISYLVKGGRVSFLKGFIGGVLNIYPVLSFDMDGRAYIVKNVIGVGGAINFILSQISIFIGKNAFYYGLLSGSKESESLALKLKQSIIERFGSRADFFYWFRTNLVMTAHLGPEVFGVVVVRKVEGIP